MFGKLWIWLGLGALAAGALVALGQQGQPVSAQASSIGSVQPVWPAQRVSDAMPHPEPEPDRIEKPPAPLPAALNPIRPGPQRYPEDAAALLFLVQSAISGQQASLAADAAEALGRCAIAVAVDEFRSAEAGAGTPIPEREIPPFFKAVLDRDLRMCQALDLHTRSQWLPLIRRGLQQDQTGIARSSWAVSNHGPNAEAVKAEVLPYLRRDALRCHEAALADLYFIGYDNQANGPTVDERAAYWRVWKNLLEAKSELREGAFRFRPSPPKDMGSPSEVQRIVDEISANC